MPNLPKNKLIRLNAPKIDRGAQTKLRYPEYHENRWRSIRLEVLESKAYCGIKGLCVECFKKDIKTIANICDHKIPVKEMERRGFDFWGASTPDNLQPLCTSCHAKKSAKEK